MSKATEAALAALHGVIADELTRRITGGEATAADLGAAIKFLKDNAITASIEDNAALAELKQKLDERRTVRKLPSPALYPTTPTAEDIDEILTGLDRQAH